MEKQENIGQQAGALSHLSDELGALRSLTKEYLYKIKIPDLTGAYIYKSLLHNGYLICKNDGIAQKVIVNEVFNTVNDAEAYMALRTSA